MDFLSPDGAVVPREKIRDYLLSPIHTIGRHKARFFRSLGYSRSNWEVLEKDLRAFLLKKAAVVEETAFGRKYEIRGKITGPNGRSAVVITVWIVLHGDKMARLVTAYPEE